MEPRSRSPSSLRSDLEIAGISTANLALALSGLAFLVSGSSFTLAFWVARRDRADVRVRIRYPTFHYPLGEAAGPFISLTASNRGRRPVKLNTYGFVYSDGTVGVCIPYL